MRRTRKVALILADELNGIMSYDANCKIYRIENAKLLICVKDDLSEWYNYPEIGEFVVCAESKSGFNKWSQCMYIEQFPTNIKTIDEMVKNIRKLEDPIFEELSNQFYDRMGNKEFNLISDILYDNTEFYEDVLKAKSK